LEYATLSRINAGQMRGRFGRILGYFVIDPFDRHFLASFLIDKWLPRPAVVAFFRGVGRGLAVVCLLLAVGGSTARADQRRDWMIDIEPVGTFLNLDIVFPGVQATLQHNIPVYGDMNRIRLRANSLLTMGFYESQADAEIRVLFLTLGISGGFQDCFRTLTFEPGEPISRGARRGMDSDALHTHQLWGFTEARFELSFPINDYFVIHNRNAFRLEGRPDRSFDYRVGVVHDGRYVQNDILALVHHPKFGALGPTLQFINYELDNERVFYVNIGGTFVTRAGFFRSDDLLFLQLLFNPGDALGGQDIGPVYGAHMFYGPFTITLAYRVVLDLGQVELR
jgi:hypothetical protein